MQVESPSKPMYNLEFGDALRRLATIPGHDAPLLLRRRRTNYAGHQRRRTTLPLGPEFRFTGNTLEFVL